MSQNTSGFANTLSSNPSERLKAIIQRYYMQYTAGCERDSCVNSHCVTSGKRDPLPKGQEAAKASIELAQITARTGELFDCDTVASASASASQDVDSDIDDTLDIDDVVDMDVKGEGTTDSRDGKTKTETEQVSEHKPESKVEVEIPEPISISELKRMVEQVKATLKGEKEKEKEKSVDIDIDGDGDVEMKATDETASPIDITKRFHDVYSSIDVLSVSFLKEDVNEPQFDLRTFRSLISEVLISENLASTIVYALNDTLRKGDLRSYLLRGKGKQEKQEKQEKPNVSCLFAILELPIWLDAQYRETLAKIYGIVVESDIPPNVTSAIIDVLEEYPVFGAFDDMLVKVNQLITIRAFSAVMSPHTDPQIIAATKFMKLIFEANSRRIATAQKQSKSLSSSTSTLPLDSFYNNALSEQLDLPSDFECWVKNDGSFSFSNYPFILEPSLKSDVLLIESRVAQVSELRASVMQAILHGQRTISPYLILEVRRDHLIEDTLQQLMIHEEEIRKEIKIKFVGEEGVDEGGVRKEFFQLIVREIFDQKYGMFVYDPEERLYWLNMNSMETGSEYELIGCLVGLALYNSVLLDVHFPLVIYKKLMGETPNLYDLRNANPVLFNSLSQLAVMDGDSVDDLALTFQVSYEKYGGTMTHDLVPNGAEVNVTGANRKEYIDKYVHWLLVESVQGQFEAFQRGFNRAAGGRALKIFRPDELDLLISGSTELDFDAFEKSTLYEPPYSKTHATVVMFWEVFRELTLDQKKQFLTFATGSDRAPIEGLGSVKFVISRHGDDSERLPSSHTCFNHFLLPAYESKEKLKERLLLAIENCEGFGLL